MYKLKYKFTFGLESKSCPLEVIGLLIRTYSFIPFSGHLWRQYHPIYVLGYGRRPIYTDPTVPTEKGFLPVDHPRRRTVASMLTGTTGDVPV